MTNNAAIGGGKALQAHGLRADVLGELHARPFTPVATPQRILHFAFLKNGDPQQNDRATLAALCEAT